MGLSSPSQGVWFPHWAEVLARVRLRDLERRTYRSAIMDYLGFCKRSRQQATVASARTFMEQIEGRHRLGVSQLASWKAALNWFFRSAKTGFTHAVAHRSPQVPAAVISDLASRLGKIRAG